jgi:hypothetical protein
MIAAQSAARVSPATPGGLRAPPAGPGVLVVPRRRMVRVNFIEDKKAASAQDADKMSLPQDGKPTDPKLQPEQFDEVHSCAACAWLFVWGGAPQRGFL